MLNKIDRNKYDIFIDFKEFMNNKTKGIKESFLIINNFLKEKDNKINNINKFYIEGFEDVIYNRLIIDFREKIFSSSINFNEYINNTSTINLDTIEFSIREIINYILFYHLVNFIDKYKNIQINRGNLLDNDMEYIL